MWKFKFWSPKEGSPANLVAEAEVAFPEGSPFEGMKLVGISVWKSSDPSKGDYYVTFPSRATGKDKEKRYFDYLRADAQVGTPAAKAATARLKNRIVATFKRDFLKQQ